jgi:serine/threonine-protein kinase
MALIGLALVYTLLNAVKPLHIDDTAYYHYAKHIAEHPLDPYGFDVFWYQHPLPANQVLAPPVLPYWWAAAIRLFGERPFMWKLWLFPFALVFVGSLYALGRRFARGLELPLVAMTVLSPAFLPALNLMLDVPALALSLGAIALFLHAADRGSLIEAAVAGLVAGLGMETKYTAFLAPAVILLYAALLRKWGLGLVAALLAGVLFAVCEGLIAYGAGESHFLCNLRQEDGLLQPKEHLVAPLVAILGGVAPAGVLLGLTALGARWRWVLAAGVVIVVGYALIALVPASQAVLWRDASGNERLTVNNLVFGTLGLIASLTTAAVVARLTAVLLRRDSDPDPGPGLDWGARRETWFLILWLALELAGYFALSPFPAVRRVMGVVVVGTLLTGRLAAPTCRPGQRRRLVYGAFAASALLGLGYYAVDLRDAFAEKEAAEQAAAWVRGRDPDAIAWYVGHWGFQFYAERAGLRPVVPDHSRLKTGDWLIVPDDRLNQQAIRIEPGAVALAAQEQIEDALPLRTVQCYYGGATPLEHHEGPRVTVMIYRVTADHVPARRRSRSGAGKGCAGRALERLAAGLPVGENGLAARAPCITIGLRKTNAGSDLRSVTLAVKPARRAQPRGVHPCTGRAKGWVVGNAAAPLRSGMEPIPGYKLRQSLGRGGFAEVWEAETGNDRTVALKFLPADDNLSAAREIRSIQGLRQLQHPHLIHIEQVVASQGYIIIGMELAEGSLLDLLEVYRLEFDSCIPAAQVCRYLAQVAEALDFLNSRRHQVDGQRFAFQHCDIKPSNLLLFGETVKISDFGLSSATSTPLQFHRRAGTLDFMAPEVFQGRLSDWTDQYALAVTYCLLRGGRLPFSDTPPKMDRTYVRPTPDLTMLSAEERPILARALSSTPQGRWPNCREFTAQLSRLLVR